MLDKEKLWIGVYIKLPLYLPVDDKQSILTNISSTMAFDESVRCLLMPQETEDDVISLSVECIYDPHNGNDEKYNAFFEKANDYIEKFNKGYKEQSE